ncbi:vWA domain-containing protein [Streptosporangium vulgare]|uniref:vWA domain-containing protein n=1 Tax=Streptosporangium vulgare TaxID=46190 RepID=UPI0036D8E281
MTADRGSGLPGGDAHGGDAGADPRGAVEALAGTGDGQPYLLGVRHHSPALAAAVPALLDAAGAEVVCVELPADFQPWLVHLADPATLAPVALAGTGGDGRLGFYPFADFSPELAAIRWARERGAEVLCCDLPLSAPAWSESDPAGSDAATPAGSAGVTPAGSGAVTPAGSGAATPPSRAFADGLAASATGREGDDMWDRAVEVLAPGCPPEAVRRAALGVGWALRQDAEASGGVSPGDLAREAYMREVLAEAAVGGRRVAAVIVPFHAPALVTRGPVAPAPARGTGVPDMPGAGGPSPATSLVPYAFDLLDSRSGYPAGIRDPRWQQAVLVAGGDPVRIRDAAARTITEICRELRAAGHTAGTGEAVETLRLACDLARLRGLPAPGRGELLEAVTTVLGQGEPLGRGWALARALETVLVGTERGRTAPGTPRSGLGPAVEAELAELRLPHPGDPGSREVRLDPLRSDLDRRREVLLQRLLVCGTGYGRPTEVTGTGDGTALTTRWQLSWTPSAAALLDLAGVRGVTAALAAEGTLRETFRRESAEGGPTCELVLAGLRAAAACDLSDLVADRLEDAASVLPATAGLPELLQALDLLEALRHEHLPGTTPESRDRAAELAGTLLEAAVRSLPGLAGSDRPEDAAALIALVTRSAEQRLGLGLDDALDTLARTGSPLIQGTALAARVLLDLDAPDTLGARAAGWIDTATGPAGRHRLSRLLTGLLVAAGPLLQSAAGALDPLLDRVDGLTDQDFLDRLPALRGGFDTLAPAARDRLLRAVTDRLGDRLDLALGAPPELVALWTAADAAGRAALTALRLPVPGLSLPPAGSGTSAPPEPPAPPVPPAQDGPATAIGEPDPRVASPGEDPSAAPSGEAGEPPAAALAGEEQEEEPEGEREAAPRRLAPADRWRLLLGRETGRLPAGARRYAHALDELYGAGRGEGAGDFGYGPGDGGDAGGQGASFPSAREWAEELDALFGTEVREEVLADAAGAGRTDVLAELDPDSVRPSIDLLTSVLTLAGGLPEQRLSRLRPLVRRLVAELARELATRLRPALTGLATPRPTRRPGGRLNLPATLRANLAHTRRTGDGRLLVVPERPVFTTRVRNEADWRLVFVVDVSGSMEASVIWSALTAAVLGGVPTLSTHFLAFSTSVIDLTDRVADPLSLLLDVRVGGGTHIAAGLAHARSLVTVPSRTLVVVVSDFEEGYPLGGLLGEVRSLVSSGVHLLGCAALDDSGAPRYSVPVAQQLVAAGMPVAALSPLALARWVGDRLRGENR